MAEQTKVTAIIEQLAGVAEEARAIGRMDRIPSVVASL